MWAGVDALGPRLADAAFAAAALTALGSVAVVASRQPARRVQLVRALVAALLLLVPIKALGLLPTLSLSGPLAAFTGLGAPRSSLGLVAESTPWGTWLARGLTLGYLGGAGLTLGALALAHLGLAWLVRRSRPPGAAADGVYASLLDRQAGPPPRRRPGLRVSDRVNRPVVVGRIVGSIILIPPALDGERPDDLAGDALRLGLLHELAHAEARDPRHTLLGQLARGVWFFLPPVWWLTAVMRLDQEFLADRLAARRFGTPGDYASRLLDLAAPDAVVEGGGSSAAIVPVGNGLPGSALFRRMAMLLHCPFAVEPEPPRWWVGAMAVAATLATLAVSTLSLRPEDTGPVDRSGTSVFQLISLVVPAQPPGVLGRAPLFELPLKLPDQFDLSVEVLGDAESLALTRIAGLPLGLFTGQPPGPTAPLPNASTGPAWHTVRLRRDGRGGITLQIDDRPILVPAGASFTLTTWLSLEPPPDREGHFRFLNLAW